MSSDRIMIVAQIAPTLPDLLDGLRSLPIWLGMAALASAWGLLAERTLVPRDVSRLARVSLAGATGVVALGWTILLLGHLNGLNRCVLTCVAVAATGSLIVYRHRLTLAVRWFAAATTRLPRWQRMAHLSILVVIAVAAISGMRGRSFDDDHRWPSASRWATAGRWVDSQRRLTNGPALAENLLPVPEVFGSTAAAHWMTTVAALITIGLAAAIGQLLGASAAFTSAAVCAIPVLVSGMSNASGDIPSAMCAVGVAYLCIKPPPRDGVFQLRFSILLGVLLAGCYSFKLTSLSVAIPSLAYLIWNTGLRSASWATVSIAVAVLLICIALWSVHTYSITGQLFDPTGKYLARTADDPMWTTGAAAGRVPTLADVARLPVELFTTSVLGQREPFGGRTGLFWPIGLFAILLALIRPARSVRSIAWTACLGLLAWCVLAPVAPKTRFNLAAFVLLTIAGSAAFESMRSRSPLTVLARTVAVIVVITGIADGVRKLMMGWAIPVPPATNIVATFASSYPAALSTGCRAGLITPNGK